MLISINSLGQTSYNQITKNSGCKPPFNRVRWHDEVDKSQKNALRILQAANEEINYHVTQTLTTRLDDLQCAIEKDSLTTDQPKIGYLRDLDNFIKKFISLYRNKEFTASNLPEAINVFEAAMLKDEKRQSIEGLIKQSNYEIANLVVESNAFRNNIGIRAAKNEKLLKYLDLHPDQILSTLKKNPGLPFRDSMIRVAAKKYPRRLYDYAAANDAFGNSIYNINDDKLVRSIARIARGRSGQLYFPFLDNIMAERITLSDIDAVKTDDAKYYKLLVQTRMDYVGRALNGEEIISMEDLDKMLTTKAKDPFIKTINELHERPNPVRFAILDQLNAQELYYLAIAGETELYTSSFVQGVYPRMMQKYGNRGDSLLVSVSFDRFKKFIKMAAGYNTLSDFLSTISEKDRAQLLMTAFVNNLEKSKGLEDGVDVADSYASIFETIKSVADEMLSNVKLNLDRSTRENNKRGMVMYNLLYRLFLSVDSTQNVDLTKEFGIPPVFNINYKSLVDDSAGKVVMQVFFYGDDDGKMSYNGFISDLNRSGWKVAAETKYWIAFSSPKGEPA